MNEQIPITALHGRRRFRRIQATPLLVFAVTYCAAPFSAATTAVADESSKDGVNVVVYLIDTLRADRLGVYGYDQRPTSPLIDQLAREGVVFERAASPAPWTLPSVASILTGTFSCEHGLLEDTQRLNPSFETLAERLKGAGYTTLGLVANVYAGPKFGVGDGYDYLQVMTIVDGARVDFALNRFPATPVYIYAHAREPHDPFRFARDNVKGFRDISPQLRNAVKQRALAYRRSTRVDLDAKRPRGATDNTDEQRERLAALTEIKDAYCELYDGAVRTADDNLGSVIDSLRKRGLWENTLFILLSDHGEELNDHGGWLHDQSLYEELVHVPLIIRFPKGKYAGRRVRSTVSLVDVMPTIFDYLQKPECNRGTRGQSLMPLIRNEKPDELEGMTITSVRMNRKKYFRPWKEQRGDDNVVVWMSHWKGVYNIEPNTFELYEMTGDPGEQKDVSAANRELADAMRDYAKQWLQRCGAGPGAAPQEGGELDEETLRHLRELGYVD